MSPEVQLQKAVARKVSNMLLTDPLYKASPCPCGLWTDKPWLYLLVSSPKALDAPGKAARDEVVMGWAKHMEECKGAA